jgi:hypothetical protein
MYSQQDDLMHTQQCRVLQQKKCQKSSRGHFFLSKNEQHPPNNGAIMTNATIIKAVMASAAEAELGALFQNAKEGVYLSKYSLKWAIHNRAPQYKPTTPQLKESQIIKSNPNEQRRWICGFTGSATVKLKANSKFIGDREDQSSGLFHKTSSSSTPCQCAKRILDINQRPSRSTTSETEQWTDQTTKKFQSQ